MKRTRLTVTLACREHATPTECIVLVLCDEPIFTEPGLVDRLGIVCRCGRQLGIEEVKQPPLVVS